MVTNMKNMMRCILSLLLLSITPILNAATIPSAPDLKASAYILVDYNTNKVLAEKNPDTRIDPASLTKLMTMYVIDHELENGRLAWDAEIPISPNAWKTEGSRMFVEAGKQVKAEELIKGIIIQSGNDASVALAEYIAGTEQAFAELMNQYAKKLGMNNTHFTNATGIPDPEHYTTARDLSLLSIALIRDFPDSYKLYSEKWFTFNGIRQPNRNRLLWNAPDVDGIKTGHSSTAGYCLAASALNGNMRLVSVVLGAESDSDRNQQTQQLLRYGFRFYETHRLYKSGQAIQNQRIWMGNKRNVSLGITDDIYVTVPQGQFSKLEAKVEVDPNLKAPVAKGGLQGKLTVRLGETLITEAPVIALEEVKEGTLWMRVQDYISMGFHKILKTKEAGDSNEVFQET